MLPNLQSLQNCGYCNFGGDELDRDHRSDEDLQERRGSRQRRGHHGRARPDRGLPRPERRRQEHDHAHAHHAPGPDLGERDGRGPRPARRPGGRAAAHRLRLAVRRRQPRRATGRRPGAAGHAVRHEPRAGARARRRGAGPAGADRHGAPARRSAVGRPAAPLRPGVRAAAPPAAALPRRAHHGARPPEPRPPLGPHPRAARRPRDDGVPDHALPRRGRRALRPPPDHRRRPDRRRGQPGGAEGRRPHPRRRLPRHHRPLAARGGVRVIGSAARDTWLLFRHNLAITLQQKFGLVFGAIQPMVFLVLFGPIFATIGTWETLVPGLIVQLGLVSTGMAGFGVVFDRRFGVLERMRVTPASRLALLLGRVLNNVVALLLQTVVLVAVGYAFGLRAPAAGLLAGLALVVVLGASLASLSYAVALTIDENLFAPVMSTIVLPLALLSGSFLPMSMAPGWLDVLSRISPFRYVLEALRDLFAGHYATGTVGLGVAVTAVLAVVSVAVGTRVFSRENA
ncbi:ABC transporter permease [Nonomuraea sp. SMC257]|uniref:Transport permease protein n=1 Tax=Nonomuraea montanisoli TaxID=2741721 RepID=A0A7Y6I9T1_9ACTN|nr:ABC transporter permease [Nonomuraea montanisoli]